MTWDATNSRLGIGTNAPATNKFIDLVYNVAATGGAGIGLRNTNSTGYTEVVFNNDTTPSNDGAFVFGFSGTSSAAGANIAYFFNRRNAPILFGTNNTERMRIFGGGNLALNSTTDSGERLQVTGTMKVTGLDNLSTTTALNIVNQAGTSLFNLRNNGNITFPGYQYSDGNFVNFGYGSYLFKAVSDLRLVLGPKGEYIHFKGNTAGVMGLGTNAPTALLDIIGSTTSAASLRIRSGTAPTSPNDGDIWFDGTDIKMRIGGVTKTFTLI
jgi:hypothetical protein